MRRFRRMDDGWCTPRPTGRRSRSRPIAASSSSRFRPLAKSIKSRRWPSTSIRYGRPTERASSSFPAAARPTVAVPIVTRPSVTFGTAGRAPECPAARSSLDRCAWLRRAHRRSIHQPVTAVWRWPERGVEGRSPRGAQLVRRIEAPRTARTESDHHSPAATRSKTSAKRRTRASSTSGIGIDRPVTFSSDVTPRSEIPHGTISLK